MNNQNNNNNKMESKRPKRQMKSPRQLRILEKTYASEQYPCEATRVELSQDLGFTDRQLQMWFCNRRLKDKNDRRKKVAKRLTDKGSVGEPTELLKSSRQESMVVERGCGSNHGSRSRSSHESWSQSRSGSGSASDSGSGSDSDSSQSIEPLEAASILGQIASLACSRQSRPQTLTPAEIESRIEKEVTARVASHVDSLRVKMEKRMQAMSAKQDRMQAEMDAKEERMRAEMNDKDKRMRAGMENMRQMLQSFHRT